MQTLKIEIPEGCVIDQVNSATGEVTFKQKAGLPPMERIKTVADILIDNNINVDEFEEQCADLPADEKAYRILKLLVKSLNQGWTPDWNNGAYDKFYPWFYMDGGSSGFRFYDYGRWFSSSIVGSRLCFKSRELAEYAAKQFTEVYKQFMTI